MAVPPHVADAIKSLRYRQRMHLSYDQYLNEPLEEIERAFVIWDMEGQRAKLEEGRQQSQ